MVGAAPPYRLDVLGPFGLFSPSGDRIEVASRRGRALLAMLASARDGIRSRGWLQGMLWSSRGAAQGQSSLRREISTLRSLINDDGPPLLSTGHGRIALDFNRVEIDLLILEGRGKAAHAYAWEQSQFLEGLDLPGEDEFEEWLRHQRCVVQDIMEDIRASGRAQPLPGGANASGLQSADASGGFLGRPMLAVLPFSNQTGDPAIDYLADGVAGELVERLSRLRWIPILAPGAGPSHARSGARARYVVDGRLRREDHGPVLTLGISEAESGRLLWTRRMDLAGERTAAALEPVLIEIVAALSSRIDDAETIRAATRPQDDLNVNDLLWRARWHHNQYTPEHGRAAEALLQEALEREPNSPEAIIRFAYFRQRQIWLKRGGEDDVRELRQLAQRAIAADYRDGRGYMIAGIAELWLKRNAAAVALLEQAISLNPSLAYAYSQLGAAHYLNNDPRRAIDMLHRARLLDMGEQYAYYLLAELAMAHAMLGETETAASLADQSLSQRPAYWYTHVIKIHCLVASGDRDGARMALDSLTAASRGFEPGFLDWIPFVDQAWPESLRRSLATAGARLTAATASIPRARVRRLAAG